MLHFCFACHPINRLTSISISWSSSSSSNNASVRDRVLHLGVSGAINKAVKSHTWGLNPSLSIVGVELQGRGIGGCLSGNGLPSQVAAIYAGPPSPELVLNPRPMITSIYFFATRYEFISGPVTGAPHRLPIHQIFIAMTGGQITYLAKFGT